jgi:hypothetical protein
VLLRLAVYLLTKPLLFRGFDASNGCPLESAQQSKTLDSVTENRQPLRQSLMLRACCGNPRALDARLPQVQPAAEGAILVHAAGAPRNVITGWHQVRVHGCDWGSLLTRSVAMQRQISRHDNLAAQCHRPLGTSGVHQRKGAKHESAFFVLRTAGH